MADLETAVEMGWPLSVVRGLTSMSGHWTRHDRFLQAAFRIHGASICGGCGGYLDETTDASRFSGPRRTHEHKHDKPVKCWTCASRADHMESLSKNEKHPGLLRWFTRVVRIGSGDAAGGA